MSRRAARAIRRWPRATRFLRADLRGNAEQGKGTRVAGNELRIADERKISGRPEEGEGFPQLPADQKTGEERGGGIGCKLTQERAATHAKEPVQ